jgi:hypothetical protein
VKIRSDQTRQGVLLECWGSVYYWFTSISVVNGIGDVGTGEFCRSVGVLLTVVKEYTLLKIIKTIAFT